MIICLIEKSDNSLRFAEKTKKDPMWWLVIVSNVNVSTMTCVRTMKVVNPLKSGGNRLNRDQLRGYLDTRNKAVSIDVYLADIEYFRFL